MNSLRISSSDLALDKSMSPLSKRDVYVGEHKKVYDELMKGPINQEKATVEINVLKGPRKILKVNFDNKTNEISQSFISFGSELFKNKESTKKSVDDIMIEMSNAKMNYLKEKEQIVEMISK